MSPVTRKTSEGLPIFYLHDIPPVACGGPDVREPRIYFGEGERAYVDREGQRRRSSTIRAAMTTSTRATKAPTASPIGELRCAAPLFSWYFGDPNILLATTSRRKAASCIRRNIRRAHRGRSRHSCSWTTIPYVVISDGRLFWIQDAYTTSDWFPYARRATPSGLNYIRNSVKVVVDAYNGTVDVYIAIPTIR